MRYSDKNCRCFYHAVKPSKIYAFVMNILDVDLIYTNGKNLENESKTKNEDPKFKIC